MKAIKDFVHDLQQVKSTKLFANPYQNPVLANNLYTYLMAMKREKPSLLLIGEAPGYKGCKLTGIPFSSGMIYQDHERFDHPFLRKLAKKIEINEIDSENSATMVWEYLSEKRITPIFWNSFPFHPHIENDEFSNRAPTAKEVSFGIEYLQRIRNIYKPTIIAGVGSKGTTCARKAFPNENIISIRHPSFGGKRDFINGMDAIQDNLDK